MAEAQAKIVMQHGRRPCNGRRRYSGHRLESMVMIALRAGGLSGRPPAMR